jgi:membrane protein DedA with SNARE-associated domain
MGAYLSDLIAYWLGRILGPKLWNIKFFAKMVSRDKIDMIGNYYHKYGVLTLIFGRFIPFGVRNALFISAGLGKMNFIKFSLSDLLACVISTSVYFPLYYFYGESVIDYVKKGNIVIFSLALLVVGIILIKKYLNRKKISQNTTR